MKVLITGACGFVGRSLITELEKKHELRLQDITLPEAATLPMIDTEQRKSAPLYTQWPFTQCEITDADAVDKVVAGVDAIIHLAGETRGLPERGKTTFTTNAVGTFLILDAARRYGVKRVFCASSINTFGTFYWRISGKPVAFSRLPLDETVPPEPEDPYSLSKLVNEQTCAAFTRAYGLTTAAFRFAGVWWDEMYEKILEKGPVPTLNWSDDLYCWVHIADIVSGICLALESESLPGFGVYTLGAADTRCPEPTIDILKRLRPDLLPYVTTKLEGRAPLLSIDHASKTFGYAPQYRLGA